MINIESQTNIMVNVLAIDIVRQWEKEKPVSKEITPSGNPEIDEASCDLVQWQRFQKARGIVLEGMERALTTYSEGT